MAKYPQQQVQPTKRSVLHHLAQLYGIAFKLGSVQTKLLGMGEDRHLVDTIVDAAFDKMAGDLPSPKIDYDNIQDPALADSTLPILLLAHATLARVHSGTTLMDKQNKVNSFMQLMGVFALSVSRLNGSPIASTSAAIPLVNVGKYLNQLAATGAAAPIGQHQHGFTPSNQAGGAAMQFQGYPQVHESATLSSSSSSRVDHHHPLASASAPTPTSASHQDASSSLLAAAQSTPVTNPQPAPVTAPQVASNQPAQPATTSAASATSATPAPTAPAATTPSSVPRSSLTWEERSQLLIADLGLRTADYRTYGGRTYFFIRRLARHFAPTLKGPAAAANKHARTYGVMKLAGNQQQCRRGVGKQAGRWILTLEAFEEYVLRHFSTPVNILY